jgi:hypothetical protein
MARFGFAVTKVFGFRGGSQHFSNVYYYSEPGMSPSNATLELVLDELVTKEKTLFSAVTSFDHGRVWSQVGTPSQNQMLVDKILSGNGSGTASAVLDRERAFLVRFRAGNDSLGRPVYLRKWWHFDISVLGGESITNAMVQNTGQLTSGMRTTLETFANGIKSITKNSIPFTLVAKSGREITGATEAHKYLEHRQLGDEWRG